MQKKRMIMLFVSLFAIAPAVLGGEIRSNGELTRHGGASCDALVKRSRATALESTVKTPAPAAATVTR